MAITEQQLVEHLAAGPDAVEEARTCLAVANAVLAEYLKGLMDDAQVPSVILDEATLLVAADEFHRRRAPNGVLNQQFAGEDGLQAVPVRISRDPLSAAYPLLAPYMDVVIA